MTTSTVHRMICALIFVAPLLAAAATAQDDAAIEPLLDPATGRVVSISDLVVEPGELAGGWLELTPLAGDDPAQLARIGDRAEDDGELRLEPQVPPGAAMLCTGAGDSGVLCEQVYLQGTAWIDPLESLDVAVRFEPGVAVAGRYLLDAWPIAGARVAVAPAGLTADRPFTIPLAIEPESSEVPGVVREVASDADGRFVLPPLAEGEYFLETVLPSGRVHRGEPFELPALEAVRLQAGDDDAVWDLGEIDVADGLIVRFEVTDLEAEPIAGARVAGRQGDTPASLISYETFADDRGVAALSGFSAEESVRLSCRHPGYRTFEHDYPLLPVQVSCTLEPLAAVAGEVLAIDGVPPAGARVSVEVIAVQPAPGTEDAGSPAHAVEPAAIDAEGRFILAELPAGEYLLKAAAPGFEVETRTITLAPGERLELESIVLLHGRALEVRVIDAETAEPIAGAELTALSPPGAAYEVSDQDGEIVLATRARETLELRLSADGYAWRKVTLTPERLAQREPLVLEMERGGRIRALVWDESTGLPCQSCRLVLEPASAELITGASGEALSETLRTGWYRVFRPRVNHLGSTVIRQDDAEMRHVRVRRGETSTVRFGERRRAVRVRFRPSPGAGWSLSARTPSRVERYHAEPGGGFMVRHRRGESLELFLHRFEPETGAEVEVRQATLPADFTAAELTLPLAGARLSGRATALGKPLAGVRVRLRTLISVTRAVAHTRPDGRFTVPHLPAGIYSVLIGDRPVQFASLRDGQVLDLGTFELGESGY